MNEHEYTDTKAQFWMRGLDLFARTLCVIFVGGFIVSLISTYGGRLL